MHVFEHQTVCSVVFTLAINLGLATWGGYTALVAGWGDVVNIDKPANGLTLGPVFKGVGEYYPDYTTSEIFHSCMR
jgi:hypothetical protein